MQLFAAVSFLPGLDQFGDGYCNITYVMNDFILDSVENKTVVISLTPVNDQPRPTVLHITPLESAPLNFTIQGYDPENDSFSGEILSCVPDKGAILQSSGAPVNCTIGLFLGSGFHNGQPTNFTFVGSGQDSGNGYNTIQVGFDDIHPYPPAQHYNIFVDVLSINEPPMIGIANQTALQNQTISLTVVTKHAVTFQITNVTDPDVYYRQMTVDISLENSNSGVLTTVVPNNIDITVASNTSSHIRFNGIRENVQAVLGTLSYVPNSNGKSKVLISVNDNGNTGKCPPTSTGYQADPCPLVATLNVTVNAGDGSNTRAGVIAGAVVGSAVLLGLIIFFVLWKYFSNTPEGYQPWTYTGVESASTNPLYQPRDMKGDNPVYVGSVQ